MTAFAERFRLHLRAQLLPSAETPVLVAISGGLDSVVLLHLLRFVCGQHVTAAHYDHAMRPDSAADAHWVRGLCRAWRVPIHVERALQPPRGEARARDARYEFLRRVRAQTGAARIITAHHRDDQLETLIFRLARGTGLRGLAGIPSARGDVIRPLLPFDRSDLLAYARARAIRWREDPTNRDTHYARNRIRHAVLPAVHAAGLDRGLEHLSWLAAGLERLDRVDLPELLREAELTEQGESWSLARPVLRGYHPATRARVMRYLLRRLGVVPGRRPLRAAVDFIERGASGSGLGLGGGVRIEREFERILLRRSGPGTEAVDRPLHIGTSSPGTGYALIGGVRYLVRWGELTSEEAVSFDARALRFPLELRGWRAGDRIRLEYGSKKLKKLFVEKRVGAGVRAQVPVLAEQQGGRRVLWVKDVARADLPSGPWQIMVEHGESD